MTCAERLENYRVQTENFAKKHLDGRQLPQSLIYDAMAYSFNAGGKRIRPALLLEFARICGADMEVALPFAAAIEMIHTYSLIHDDLPCMDNDDLRRGKPTSHVVFGEAIAVLAGDGLLNTAAETMLSARLFNTAPENAVAAMRTIMQCAGCAGMIGGQTLDIVGEEKELGIEEVTRLEELKTGELIRAACIAGCQVAGAGMSLEVAAGKYADAVGLAFQIRDDLLDAYGDTESLGKTAGKDVYESKSTFLTVMSRQECELKISELTNKAAEEAEKFPEPEFLVWLARKLAFREK